MFFFAGNRRYRFVSAGVELKRIFDSDLAGGAVLVIDEAAGEAFPEIGFDTVSEVSDLKVALIHIFVFQRLRNVDNSRDFQFMLHFPQSIRLGRPLRRPHPFQFPVSGRSGSRHP